MSGDPSQQTRALLLSRVRSVAFAALGAGVSEEDLQAAVRTAVDAQNRRAAAERAHRHLHAV